MNQLRFGGVLIFLLLFIGLLIIWMIDTVTTPVVKGPYQETNRAVLESVKPRDLIICAIENPVPPTTKNISKSGLVTHNIKGRDTLGIIFFNDRDFTLGAFNGIRYSHFSDCKVSIIEERAEKVRIIGEAVLDGYKPFIRD